MTNPLTPITELSSTDAYLRGIAIAQQAFQACLPSTPNPDDPILSLAWTSDPTHNACQKFTLLMQYLWDMGIRDPKLDDAFRTIHTALCDHCYPLPTEPHPWHSDPETPDAP